MPSDEKSAGLSRNPAASLLPARHPRLRDAAIFLAILSTICYFAFSEGVRSFGDFISKIVTRLTHYLN
jgi:hypothetical protein